MYCTIYTRTRVCVVYVYVRRYMYVYVYIYVLIYVYVCIYMYVHSHTHRHTYTHTLTLTHTNTGTVTKYQINAMAVARGSKASAITKSRPFTLTGQQRLEWDLSTAINGFAAVGAIQGSRIENKTGDAVSRVRAKVVITLGSKLASKLASTLDSEMGASSLEFAQRS